MTQNPRIMESGQPVILKKQNTPIQSNEKLNSNDELRFPRT
ncbi:hypothetical protein [Acetobacterium bakii]|nr:hypothetical protein [Acetobacterium bakii]